MLRTFQMPLVFTPEHNTSGLYRLVEQRGSGEPAHMRTLARAFATRKHKLKNIIPKF